MDCHTPSANGPQRIDALMTSRPSAGQQVRRIVEIAAVVAAAVLLAVVAASSGEAATPPAGTPPAEVARPAASDRPDVSARPTGTLAPSLQPLPTAPEEFVFPGRASRVVVPQMGIDLAVVSSDLAPPPDNFPLCDVAQYLTTYRQPGEPGTTYIYAHARTGMFLPLLHASLRADGAEMIGMEVLVYTSDSMLYRYRVFEVERHETEYRLADGTPPGEERLILQTSEGPRGTEGKLVVAADLIDVVTATSEEANPRADPQVCE